MTTDADGPFAPESLWIGVYDALSARLVADHRRSLDAGQPRALWVSSYCVSAALRACPDASIVTSTEMISVARQIDAAAPDLPIVLDCDCGYGDATVFGFVIEEVCRTTRVTAVCIEDKVFPKRNSFYVGHTQSLEPIPVFQEKLTIADATRRRQGSPLQIIGRTEALVVGDGVDTALRRLSAFAEAGADALMVQATGTLRDLLEVGEAWAARSDVPLIAVPTLYPTLSPEDFWRAGFQVYVYANQLLRSAGLAQQRLLAHLMRVDLPIASLPSELWTLDEMNAMVDADRVTGHRHEIGHSRTAQERFA